MIKNKDSLGFSVVEVLLVLVVVGILGFTGWFVYHSRQAADKDYDSQAATSAGSKLQTTQGAEVAQENELKPDGEERCFDGLCLTSTTSFGDYGELIKPSDHSQIGFWLNHDLGSSDRIEFNWDDNSSGCAEWGGCSVKIITTEKLKDYAGVSLVKYVRVDTEGSSYSYAQEVLKSSVVSDLGLTPKKEGTFYFDKYHFSKGGKSYLLTYGKSDFESMEQAEEFSSSSTAKDAASIQTSLGLEK